jgi:hypothetical protein
MRHASDVDVADDITTRVPDVADALLRDLDLMRGEVAMSALESVLSRLARPLEETILPFGSYLP